MTYFLELVRIAWRSVTQRTVPSLLTILSMALGVCLVVMVLTIVGVVENSFRTTANLGYNMLVGAKGGQEQLTLNSVFYLSKPVENVSYDFFMEFHKQDRRDAELANSYRETARRLRETSAKTAAALDPLAAIAGDAITADLEALDELDRRIACDYERVGKYGQFCAYAIPLCMGDYVEQFRVVGTTPEFFELLDLSFQGAGKKFAFAQGRAFQAESKENSFFEAVVGSAAAKQLKLKLGDKLNPSHGAPDGHKHQRPFTVVGILSPTGSANDRAVFVNMEGFYLMEDHAKPVEEEPVVVVDAGAPSADAKPKTDRGPVRLPVEEREITAMLVRNANPMFAVGMMNGINEGKDGMAVAPVGVISGLFDVFVGPIKSVLLLLAVAICFVSGISILVSIYNSMNERRHEIAVMRALGAGRGTVMSVILFEAVILALAGGLVGWLAGHVGAWSASGIVEERTGVQIGFYHADPTLLDLTRSIAPSLTPGDPAGLRGYIWNLPAETVLLPMLVLIATIVGVWPAIAAYQTDVAKSLGK